MCVVILRELNFTYVFFHLSCCPCIGMSINTKLRFTPQARKQTWQPLAAWTRSSTAAWHGPEISTTGHGKHLCGWHYDEATSAFTGFHLLIRRNPTMTSRLMAPGERPHRRNPRNTYFLSPPAPCRKILLTPRELAVATFGLKHRNHRNLQAGTPEALPPLLTSFLCLPTQAAMRLLNARHSSKRSNGMRAPRRTFQNDSRPVKRPSELR